MSILVILITLLCMGFGVVIFLFLTMIFELDNGGDRKMTCPYCREQVVPIFNRLYETPQGVYMEMHMTVWGCPKCGKIIDEVFY